jgi:hypothetical protein
MNCGAGSLKLPRETHYCVLLLFFSLLEVLPQAQRIRFGKSKLMLGEPSADFSEGWQEFRGHCEVHFLLKAAYRKKPI